VGCAKVPGVALTAGQCIVNGGNERANGVEAEVTLVPVEGLTLGGNLSYTHVSLSDVPHLLLAPDGSYWPVFLLDWTGSLSAQYRGPDMNALGNMDLLRGTHIVGRIDADYTSSSYGSTPNSVAGVEQAAQIPARTIVNAPRPRGLPGRRRRRRDHAMSWAYKIVAQPAH
jgi:iron complex outermembrane receptor protein